VSSRREFITLLGGAAAAWPVSVRAQQPRERTKRIGVFMPGTADDPEYQARNAAFLLGLGALGWDISRSLRIEYRWGRGDTERYRTIAAELVALAPDVILALGTATVSALLKATRTVPIVFANVTDPVGGSLVTNLARPGGNVTGFASTEFGFATKWLELLKEMAPRVRRVAVMRDSAIASQMGLFGAMQSRAPSLGVELRPVDMHEAGDIERAVMALAGEPNGGLIVTSSARGILHRDLIIALAARHQLPTIYGYRTAVVGGGLMSYGADESDQFRRAAAYVDRILKGEKPGDLPVQNPTKYDLVVNLKTAKVLGLEIPPSLLAIADELIE
jgi:putative tryptophan/tyrosine transport system substrate-binding protein